MTTITAQLVKDLREMTGAGPLDCKKALEETGGDIQKAVEYLRERGAAKAIKKLNAGRTMNEGLIETYLHFNRRLGVMVEINCETDFVANTDNFSQLLQGNCAAYRQPEAAVHQARACAERHHRS